MTTITKKAAASANRRFVASPRLASDLQEVLVDLIALHLQAKQAHWNVVGRNFRDLHLQLDDIVELGRESSDTIAERMRALGATPDGRAPTVAATTKLQSLPEGERATSEAVDLISDSLRTAVGTIRKVHDEVDADDPSTSDLLHAIIDHLKSKHGCQRRQRDPSIRLPLSPDRLGALNPSPAEDRRHPWRRHITDTAAATGRNTGSDFEDAREGDLGQPTPAPLEPGQIRPPSDRCPTRVPPPAPRWRPWLLLNGIVLTFALLTDTMATHKSTVKSRSYSTFEQDIAAKQTKTTTIRSMDGATGALSKGVHSSSQILVVPPQDSLAALLSAYNVNVAAAGLANALVLERP